MVKYEGQIMADTGTGKNKTVIFARNDEGWNRINGKIDTGADTTVGSLENHGKFCLAVWPYVGSRNIYAVTADKAKHQITHEGAIHLRANNTDLGKVKILLVKTPHWKNVLIGRDFLERKGLVPTFN